MPPAKQPSPSASPLSASAENSVPPKAQTFTASHESIFWGNGPIPWPSVERAVGYFVVIPLIFLVGFVVFLAVVVDFLDRVLAIPFWGYCKDPQSGLLMSCVRWFNRVTVPFNKRFVKHVEDSFLINALLLLGGLVPLFFFYCLWDFKVTGRISVLLFLSYHVFRLGPYFMNFAYVYTLCHKEGHSRRGLYAEPYNRVLRYGFNWWVALFYGVMPASFAIGHSINHHKYNNGPLDVVSVGDQPRDSAKNWLRYPCRFGLYALNVSTIRQFAFEGEWLIVAKVVWGSLWFWAWIAGMYAYTASLPFVLMYLIFPMGENILLLSCINWTWHAFLDNSNPEDPYVGSVTLFDGPINVLNEDFHVVHHQYPGVHWTEHEAKYHKHEAEYVNHGASMFRGTHAFELFFLIILGDYDTMAEKYWDVSGKLTTKADKIALLQRRLRTCWWGPHCDKLYMQRGWETVQDSDNYAK